jgi:hypothetical protein
LRAFDQWIKSRNDNPAVLIECPADLLEAPYPDDVLDHWLAAFIHEIRNADGGLYTPDSINCITAGTQCYLRCNLGTKAPNIVDRKCHRFPLKRNALDHVFRKLRSEGVGVVKKRAAVISPNQEEKLWQQKVLDLHSPQALLNSIFYYNGKFFLPP